MTWKLPTTAIFNMQRNTAIVERRRGHPGLLLLLVAAVFAGVVANDGEDWDEDDEGTRKVTAPFDVNGEVRHDWGQSNLREWDGAVRLLPLNVHSISVLSLALRLVLGSRASRNLSLLLL